MIQNLETKNFGWSEDQFKILKDQIQQGEFRTFRAELMPHLKDCSIYCMNLAKKWLKKVKLSETERQLVKDALTDAFVRFEQRMSNGTIEYGNVKDWLVGNAFSRFQDLFEKEQKEINRLEPIDNLQISVGTEREEDVMVFLIAKVLDKMPDDAKYFYKRTLKMLYWQGYSIEEIAGEIKVGYENLRKELSAKIRPLFKTELEQACQQFNINLAKSRVK
jgi:DNA-directed RNA polymerase specialized sigma24 family protein